MNVIVKNITEMHGDVLVSIRESEKYCIVLYGFATAPVNVTVELLKEGAEAIITGVVIGHEGECSLHTIQRHVAPHTTSDLLVKTALMRTASFRFHGEIKLESSAQHANAYQRNENKLMSPHARVDTKPELEILANEVRCTHGATVGKLDDLMLFYLASRGLPREEAEALALNGFLSSALPRITGNDVQALVQEYIRNALKNSH